MAVEKIQFRISFLCGDKEYFSVEDLASAINAIATSNIKVDSLMPKNTSLVVGGNKNATSGYAQVVDVRTVRISRTRGRKTKKKS